MCHDSGTVYQSNLQQCAVVNNSLLLIAEHFIHTISSITYMDNCTLLSHNNNQMKEKKHQQSDTMR